MKKIYLKTMALALGLLSWSATTNAQNLLSEDFSTCVGTTPPTGWVDNDIAGSGFFWHFDNPGGRTLNSPISAPFATFDSEEYAGGSVSGEESALESVAFDASGVTGSIFLSFDQYFDGDYGGEYHVEVFNGTAWVEVLSDISGGITNNPDHQSINITTALSSATNAQVRFRWVGDYSEYWFVDNVSVDVVSCAPVSALTLAGLSENTADITWTAGGSETSWNIEWGTPGYAVGTGAELGAATFPSTAYQITGLTANTSYDVYVQANCGGSGLASWFGPFSITTACTATNVPYTQDFESAISPNMPSCTSIENAGTGNNWTTNSPSGYGFNTQVLQYSYNPSNPANAWFYTQGINLTAGTNYQITYDYGDANYYVENLKVAYGTAPTSASMTTTLADHATLADGILASDLVTFIAPTTGIYYFGFNAHSIANQNQLYVDNIVIDVAPACPAVTALTTTSVSSNTADITWTAGGLETAWNIEWGAPGYAPGTGAEIGAASFPSNAYQITGLTADTHYDVYVQADCNGGGLATWFGPLDVFTGYCIVTSTNTSYGVQNFTTTDGVLNIDNTTGPGTYNNYSNMVVANFIGGTDVSFSITPVGTSNAGMGIWLDWNNNLIFDASEQVYNSGGYVYSGLGTIAIPLGTPNGDYRMRVVVNYLSGTPTPCGDLGSGSYGEAEDYTFKVITQPSCMPISNLTTNNIYTDSVSLTWTAGGIEPSWNIQWGLPGFAPGTGAEIGAATSPTITYTVNGLNPSTTYDIYVQANCGSDSSFWALVNVTTLCAPISALPWTENFDAMTALGLSVFPNCWIDESGDWSSNNSINGLSFTAPNYVSMGSYGDDYLWTPEFNLTAGSTYEFAFRWIGNGSDEYVGGAYYSPSQSSVDAVQMGTNFINTTDLSSSTDYKKEIYCFTPTTSGVYSFGIYVTSGYSPKVLSFDNFSVRIPSANAGVNGATTVCQTGGLVDLNSIITINDTTGVWAFTPNPSAIQNDTLFNPAFLPSGTTNVYYIVGGCIPDSAMATINIYPKSNAGTDGTVSTCNYGPLNLFDGLTGSVDLGGQWYNPASQPITGSVVNFNGQIAANYNYIYVVSNGVCPNDTSVIEIQLQDCAGVDEYELKGFVLYPNPSNGVINIQYSGKGEDVKLDVVDTKGAIVWSKQILFNDGTKQTIDLSTVENGVYYINMTSKNGGSVMKVIKN